MAEYRQIHTKIWKDEWFLDLSPDEKLLFIYLFSNESTSVAGIYRIAKRVIEFETGLTAKQVASALAKFEKDGKAIYRDGIVWVTKLRQYNANPSPKVQACIARDLEDIPRSTIRTAYDDYYSANNGADTICIPYQQSEIPYSELDTEHEHEHEHEHDIPSVAEAGAADVAEKPVVAEPKPKTELMTVFLAASGLKMPTRKTDVAWWWSSIGELYEIVDRDVGKGKRVILQAVGELRGKGLTVADPNSIIKTTRSIAANGGGGQVVF